MSEIFNSLSAALYQSKALAIGASFIWGLMSILLSPCHLTSIPLIIGYILKDKEKKLNGFSISVIFSAGILITIVTVGFVTSLMGRIIGDFGIWNNILISAVFLVFGLYFLNVLNFDFSLNTGSKIKDMKRNYIGSFIMGILFGAGVGPCTFAYFAPIMAIVFSYAKTAFWFSFMLVLSFALGHVSIIILAGSMTDRVSRYIDWSSKARGFNIVKKTIGVLMIALAVYYLLKEFVL